MFKARTLVKACLVATLLAPAAALASPVYGTDVGASDYSGSRSTAAGGLGLLGGGSATIDWVITDNGDGTLHYAYTLTETDKHRISHFILDLSDDCTDFGTCFSNLVITSPDTSDSQEFATYNAGGPGASNPGMPGSITGVKIDSTTDVNDDGIFSFSFDSDRVAVWGDFYSKGGNPPDNGYAVWDAGLADHTLDDTGKFIAVPDTVTTNDEGFCVTHPDLCTTQGVPEPATLALFGAGLAGLGILRRRRRGI